ncbi:hypothetical protein MtrunA17_Chr4g0049451 [Medicago truncatula]|uniref:Uncharacterized protein n=1 Tax=Medicago truncatula TaxID=3880 RepID=A0A396IED5_MEDTR|nr:hypothetical protein MtrunA17_Chr4g0049451 [Medicago truncatula]
MQHSEAECRRTPVVPGIHQKPFFALRSTPALSVDASSVLSDRMFPAAASCKHADPLHRKCSSLSQEKLRRKIVYPASNLQDDELLLAN